MNDLFDFVQLTIWKSSRIYHLVARKQTFTAEANNSNNKYNNNYNMIECTSSNKSISNDGSENEKKMPDNGNKTEWRIKS